MLVGYARVSTHDQNLELQKDALQKAGCERIFMDQVSGSIAMRPGLEKTMDFIREGDTLVVWRLDRLGRSLKHLIELVTQLDQKNVGFKSLMESMDTNTTGGRLIFHLFGALAEFERNLISERTRAGLSAAKSRGRKGGRRLALDVQQREFAINLYKQRKHSVEEVCHIMGISKPTLYSYIRKSSAASVERKHRIPDHIS